MIKDQSNALRKQGIICSDRFDKLCLLEVGSLWAEEQSARFQLWAYSLGVLAHQHANADRRLRKGPDMIQIILQLLESIEANLNYLITLTQAQSQICLNSTSEGVSDVQEVGSDSDGFSSGDSSFTTPSLVITKKDSDPVDPITKARTDVEMTITRLNRIARFIRQSSTASRNSKAEKFAAEDDNAALYTQVAKSLIEYRFGNTIHSLKIRERLATTLVQRRNRIAWIRSKPYPSRHAPLLDQTVPQPKPFSNHLPQPFPKIGVAQTPVHILNSNPTASTYEPPPLQLGIPNFSSKTSSRAPSIYSSASARVRALDIPKPPKVNNGKEFWCPYCGDSCPAKDASAARWRSHLMKDLLPYVCLFEDCPHSCDVFRTFDDWVLHTQNFHQTKDWTCAADSHVPYDFGDEQSFNRHLEYEHSKNSAPSEILKLKILGQRPTFQIFDLCLFCGLLPEEFSSLDSSPWTHERQAGLQRHIAHHMEQLALESAKWIDQIDDDHSVITSSSKAKKRATEIFEIPLEFEDPPITTFSKADVDKDWKGVLPTFEPPEPDPLLSDARNIELTLNSQWDFFPRRPYEGQKNDELLKAFVEQYLNNPYVISNLKNDLLDVLYRFEWPPGQHGYYIPINYIEDLVDVATVSKQLQTDYSSDLEPQKRAVYAKDICSKAKKLYALLLCINKGDCVVDFLLEGTTDMDLPFLRTNHGAIPTIQTTGAKFELCTSRHFETCLKHDHAGCGVKALISWSPRDVRILSRDQWQVLSPIFEPLKNGRIPHQEFNENTIFPYVEDYQNTQDSYVKSGGYSHVWGVRMHWAHQRIYKSTNPMITQPLLAIKRPFSQDIRDFKKEANMLSTLALRSHPHLIKLLATYKYKGNYHFVFPYANTNLRGYWSDTGLPYRNRDTYLWFLNQLCGLASGVNTIHNFKATIPLDSAEAAPNLKISVGKYLTIAPEEKKFGRHGDIKPENILWSNELPESGKDGILQLTDMGCGRFHRLESRSGIDASSIGGSPVYAPPEVSLAKLVSRSYDIWSLGCVFMEFATWLIGGKEQVYHFASMRALEVTEDEWDDLFYTIITEKNEKKHAIVREGVTNWFTDLREHKRCSNMLKDILAIVEDGMLVVDSNQRIQCYELVTKLEEIIQQAKNDNSYLLGDAPIVDPEFGVKLPQGTNTKYALASNEEPEPRVNAIEPRTTDIQLPGIVI